MFKPVNSTPEVLYKVGDGDAPEPEVEVLYQPEQDGNYGAVPAIWYSLVRYQGRLWERKEMRGPRTIEVFLTPWDGTELDYKAQFNDTF